MIPTKPTERTTMNGKPIIRVPVKTVLNLHSAFKEKLLSDGPALALGEGCAYSCAFCYVPAIYQKLDRIREALAAAGKRHDEVVILREAALEVLRGQLLHADGSPRFLDPNDRRVVYSSPADDVAANYDLARATVEACKLILQFTNWQIRLLSKSTLLPKIAGDLLNWADVQHEQVLSDGIDIEGQNVTEEDIRARMIFGVSTGTLDDRLAAAIEEGTPRVTKRIESLHVLQDNGFRTYAMVCPSLPMAGAMDQRKFAEECALALRYKQCEHVWAEVINLRGESFKRTLAALIAAGFNRDAVRLEQVMRDSNAWEEYNRNTFLAHAFQCEGMVGKLRYLTYVTPKTRGWWEKHIARGAVLLGKDAHE